MRDTSIGTRFITVLQNDRYRAGKYLLSEFSCAVLSTESLYLLLYVARIILLMIFFSRKLSRD